MSTEGVIKAVIFDLDRTLFDGRTWLLMTEALGLSANKHWEIYQRLVAGELSYSEAEAQVFALYRSSPLAIRTFIESHCASLNPRPEALEVTSYLRATGYTLAIVSSSFDIQVESFARKLGIPHWYANAKFVFEDNSANSRFVRFDAQHPSGELKVKQIGEFCRRVGIEPLQCAYVGDDINDIGAFKVTGRGIAVYCLSDELRRVAWRECETLTGIMNIL